LLTTALTTSPIGPSQLQAAIAAVHAEATSTEDTDWAQILGLHALLDDLSPNPVVTLNRAIALALVHGPHAGLCLLDMLSNDPGMARHHRLPAVHAHLLEQAGDHAAARDAYFAAARRSTSAPEKRYPEDKARKSARCVPAPTCPPRHRFSRPRLDAGGRSADPG